MNQSGATDDSTRNPKWREYSSELLVSIVHTLLQILAILCFLTFAIIEYTIFVEPLSGGQINVVILFPALYQLLGFFFGIPLWIILCAFRIIEVRPRYPLKIKVVEKPRLSVTLYLTRSITLAGILIGFGGLVWANYYLTTIGSPFPLSNLEINNIANTIITVGVGGIFIVLFRLLIDTDSKEIVFYLNTFFAEYRRIEKKQRSMITNQEIVAEPLRKAIRKLDSWLHPNVTLADKHTLVPQLMTILMFLPNVQQQVLDHIKELGIAITTENAEETYSTLTAIYTQLENCLKDLKGVKTETEMTFREKLSSLFERESTRNLIIIIASAIFSTIALILTGVFHPFW